MSSKIFIAICVFLLSTQVVYDLLYASGKLPVQIYSVNSYTSSAFIEFILVIIGMTILINGDSK